MKNKCLPSLAIALTSIVAFLLTYILMISVSSGFSILALAAPMTPQDSPRYVDTTAAGSLASDHTVCPSGPPTCDYSIIQDAVDDANIGDTIKVATGTYNQVNNLGGLAQVVYLYKTVTIQGGYTTDFSDPPKPHVNLTTIDAEGQGRGIYITGSHYPTVQGFRITGGNATTSGLMETGGGVYIDMDSSAILRDNQVFSNTASYGGGGLAIAGSSPIISQNVFSENSVNYEGGGLAIYSSDATISDNQIISNTASGWGGGMFVGTGYPTLNRNMISGNTSGNGGGLVLDYSHAVLVNNVVADNSVGNQTSGIRISDSSPYLFHNTIARNTGGDGVGILVDGDESGTGSVFVTNTILVSQTVGIYVSLECTATLGATLWGSDVWANGMDWTGGGTINTSGNLWGNPDFVGYEVGNYHIGPDSDARDEGIDAGVMNDIDNQPRPFQTPDLGADEYWPPGALKFVYLPLVLSGSQ